MCQALPEDARPQGHSGCFPHSEAPSYAPHPQPEGPRQSFQGGGLSSLTDGGAQPVTGWPAHVTPLWRQRPTVCAQPARLDKCFSGHTIQRGWRSASQKHLCSPGWPDARARGGQGPTRRAAPTRQLFSWAALSSSAGVSLENKSCFPSSSSTTARGPLQMVCVSPANYPIPLPPFRTAGCAGHVISRKQRDAGQQYFLSLRTMFQWALPE